MLECCEVDWSDWPHIDCELEWVLWYLSITKINTTFRTMIRIIRMMTMMMIGTMRMMIMVMVKMTIQMMIMIRVMNMIRIITRSSSPPTDEDVRGSRGRWAV